MKSILFLAAILVVGACSVTEPTKPQCQEFSIQHVTNDIFIVFWIPELDPAHQEYRVTIDGALVTNMCRRTRDLTLSDIGRWSFFARSGQTICIDKDAQIFVDDCECTTTIPE